MSFRKFLMGRGADIRLYHGSVSKRHAEVTIVSVGRYFLTDWRSLLGMWICRRGQWPNHRRGYVSGPERVRFGEQMASMAALMCNTPLPQEGIQTYASCPSPKPGDREVYRRPPRAGRSMNALENEERCHLEIAALIALLGVRPDRSAQPYPAPRLAPD